MLPPAADESQVRGYIFRFLSQLSILAPELGLGEIATVLSRAVLGSLGKDSMSDITCVWKQTSITCLLVDRQAQNATAVLVVDIMALFNPEISVLIQKHHPYTGNLNSETLGDSKNAFLHRGGVLARFSCGKLMLYWPLLVQSSCQ